MKTTYPSCTTHRLRHLLVTPESLYPQADGLELSAHLIEFLHISTGADKVLRHHFTSILCARMSLDKQHERLASAPSVRILHSS